MKIIYFFCLFLISYIFFIYPVFIVFISKIFKKKRTRNSNSQKSICIIVPAYNEEMVIEEKIKSIISLNYPRHLVKIVLVSDGSTDNTVQIMKKYANDNTHVLDIEDRKGKTNIINKAMEINNSELTLFSDANVILDKDCLIQLNHSLSKTNVGAVAGSIVSYDMHTNNAKSVGLYYRYEEKIKIAESNTGSIMGADGSIFGIKSDLFKPLPLYVIDDFTTSMRCIFQGYDLILNKKLIGYEKKTSKTHDEFKRKVRIANRSLNAAIYMRKEILKMKLWNIFKFFSHKVLRWFAFPLFLLSLILCLFLVHEKPYQLLLISKFFFVFLCYVGYKRSNSPKSNAIIKLSTTCYFFLMTNYATFLGILQVIKGKKIAVWVASDSSRQ